MQIRQKMLLGAASILLHLPCHAASDSWFATQDGSWTDRLGLRFKDDCQEHVGIGGFFAWALSWISGRHGQQQSGICESREMRCPDATKITGLQVRYERQERGDRDYYDFRPRCGSQWMGWLGMTMPEAGAADHSQEEAAICPGMVSVTGVQVMRGRIDWRDQDTYNFKLRCGKRWADMPLGLAFDGLRETRSATCPSGGSLAGLRVHRGFQDWGDVDTYEFQCFCAVKPGGQGADNADQRTGGRGSGKGNRGGGGSQIGDSEDFLGAPHANPKRKRSSSGGSNQNQRKKGSQKPSSGTFGSRRAEADAAAEEVRAELRAAAAARAQQARALKDEL